MFRRINPVVAACYRLTTAETVIDASPNDFNMVETNYEMRADELQ